MALILAQFLENAGAVNHARDFRRIHSRMLMGWDVRAVGGLATSGIANGGIARSGDMLVAQRAAGANMSVDVAVGFALVGGTESATQGEYGAFNDAVTNVVISASDPTNPRIDVIGVRIRDAEYSGANNDAALIVVTGTPAGVPAVPTLPADFLSLAHVAVAAAAATIVNANITDKRQRISANGGIAPMTSTTRPTVGLWTGQVIIETDTVTAGAPVVMVYDGTNWVPLGQFARAWSVITDTLLGGDGALTFSSIPATFTHLELVLYLRASSANTIVDLGIRCNADTGANYDYDWYQGFQGNNANGAEGHGVTAAVIGRAFGNSAAANGFGASRVTIPHYRGAANHKMMTGHSGNAETSSQNYNQVTLGGGRWRNTGAITQLDIFDATGAANSWKSGSRGTLVGIR